MKKTKSLTAFLILILLSIPACQEDNDIEILSSTNLFLLDKIHYEIVSMDTQSEESTILGKINVPELMYLDYYDNTNSNLFIDEKSKSLAASAWKDNIKYFLLFDYESGDLTDSIQLSYPFTNRFFYSPNLKTIYAYRSGKLYSIRIDDKQVNTDVIIMLDSLNCANEHQGINNFDNTFYSYGCNITTIINLETKTNELVDKYYPDPSSLNNWHLIYSVGLAKDRSYLLGFGSYTRHFPEDPDYIGNFDSTRTELYAVRKNLIDGSFSETQIDLIEGENNGYFNSEIEKYFLKHNDDVLILNSDLTLLKTIKTESMAIIKQ